MVENKNYHSFVFDTENRKFVGKFEEMYKKDLNGNFDSWHQDDLRDFSKRIVHTLLEDYTFETVVDIGCGKAQNTQFFKKRNNKVLGLDISETALKIGRSKFPDIFFSHFDLNSNFSGLSNILSSFFKIPQIDLIIALEVLSYIENWRQVLEKFKSCTNYCLCGLYLPDDPIGFVKSEDEFLSEFENHFNLIEFISLKSSKHFIAFGEIKETTY